MPSKIFSAAEVHYGQAPFTKVQLGYNAKAGCLNLIIPGSVNGALQLVTGLGGPGGPEVSLEGLTCTIGSAVKARFIDEAIAANFASCLGAKAPEQKEIVAPSTPPSKSSAMNMAAQCLTPPRVKRAKIEVLEEPLKKL